MPQFVVYASEGSTEPVLDADRPWADLERLLCREPPRHTCEPHPVHKKDCRHKYGTCWSPVRLVEGGERCDADVTHVTVLVLDLDHLTDQQVGDALQKLDPYHYLAHVTHSHRPGDASLRVLVELSAEVPAASWRDFRRRAVELLGVPCDPACKDLSRMYFTPQLPVGAEWLHAEHPGASLDVAPLLGAEPSSNSGGTAVPDYLDPPREPEQPAHGDLEEVRSAVAEVIASKSRKKGKDEARHRELADLLRRARDGEPLADEGQRHWALLRVVGCLAWNYVGPWEPVREFLRPSVSHWADCAARVLAETAPKMFEEAREKKAADHAARERERAAIARWQEAPPEALAGDAWRSKLIPDDDGWRSCAHNAVVILACDPSCRVRFNLVTKEVEVGPGSAFAGVHASVLPITVCAWLEAQWGVSLRESVVASTLLAAARRNDFDPVADYLRGLRWDGVERLATWLEVYCRAEAQDEAARRWNALMGRRWMVGAAARALYPGCQVDNVLVFEGAQGTGKTSTLRILFGDWFASDRLHLGDKDSKLLAACSWGVELAEMASFKRGDDAERRAFLTQVEDRFRPPYGRAIEAFKRRCVFGGTTNPDRDSEGRYLTDPTGNRRLQPVACGDADLDALRRDRDQLWAEAVAALEGARACADCAGQGFPARRCAEHRWWFDREESDRLEVQVTAKRVHRDVVLEESIAAWWGSLTIKPDRGVTLRALLVEACKMDPGRATHNDERRVARAARAVGFERTNVRAGEKVLKLWVMKEGDA